MSMQLAKSVDERRKIEKKKHQQLVSKINEIGYKPAAGWLNADGHIQYPKNSHRQRIYKKITSSIVRRKDIASGNQYRKHFDYWWVID